MTTDIIKISGNEIQTERQLTGSELAERFVAHLHCSPKTRETYIRAIRQFVYWIQDNNIDYPTREDVATWIDYLGQDHKPTTVQSYLTAVKQLFKWTADEELYPEITRKVKAPKIDTDVFRHDALTAGQAAICLDQIETDTPKGRRDYAIFLLMGTCGLRCIEVQRADIQDMRIHSGKSVLFLQGKGKLEKNRFVVLPQEVETAIRASLADRKGAAGSDPLFASDSNHNAGGRLTTRSISRIAKGRMIDAGFNSDRLTAHSLRHTAVTTALENGETLDATQTFARHSDPKTTQIYNHNRERVNNTCSQTVYTAIAKQRNAEKAKAQREKAAEETA